MAFNDLMPGHANAASVGDKQFKKKVPARFTKQGGRKFLGTTTPERQHEIGNIGNPVVVDHPLPFRICTFVRKAS